MSGIRQDVVQAFIGFVDHDSNLYLSEEKTQDQCRSSVRPPHPFLAPKKGLHHGGNFRITGLNLSHQWSHLRYHGGFQREEAPYGTQTEDAPILHRFSAPLANSHTSSRRGGTTSDSLAQSVSARPAPTGATRSPAPAAAG